MQSDAVPPPAAAPLIAIALLGLLVQLGGGALLLGLFAVLRHHVLRRGYFTAWVWAWAASTTATLALVLHFAITGGTPPSADAAVLAMTLAVLYQAAKSLGFLLFVRGTSMYVSGGRRNPAGWRMVVSVVLVFSLVTGLAATDLNRLLAWQAVIAVPALAYCARSLLMLPSSRRSVGSVATGVSFALLTCLWLGFAASAGAAVMGVSGALAEAARGFVDLNAYTAMMGNIMVGFGMVVLLMEDAKREVSDAHAELRISHDQLRRAALYDELTDSLNRRAFGEGVGLEMVRATFGTAVLADLDNLKLVNDRYGHSVGDAVLRQCADVLRSALRPYDKLYRWGGDEFLLIMPSARAADVVARLSAVLDAARVDSVARGRDGVPLEVSLGAADYASAEELGAAIERADRAMYQEKIRRKGTAARNTPASLMTVSPPPAIGAGR